MSSFIKGQSQIASWFEANFNVVFRSRGREPAQIELSQVRYRQLGAKLFSMAMHLIVGLLEIKDTQLVDCIECGRI